MHSVVVQVCSNVEVRCAVLVGCGFPDPGFELTDQISKYCYAWSRIVSTFCANRAVDYATNSVQIRVVFGSDLWSLVSVYPSHQDLDRYDVQLPDIIPSVHKSCTPSSDPLVYQMKRHKDLITNGCSPKATP